MLGVRRGTLDAVQPREGSAELSRRETMGEREEGARREAGEWEEVVLREEGA